MGVSFIGIATKADHETVVRSLEATFLKEKKFYNLSFDSEHYFDTLIYRKGADNIIDIFSSPSGTVLTVSYNVYEMLEKWHLSSYFDFNYFDISETSMEHRFAFFSGGKEQLGMNVYDEGSSKRIFGPNFLNIQQEEDVFMFVFPRAVDEYLPAPFHRMDYATNKLKRYILTPLPIQEDKQSDAPVQPGDPKKSFWKKLFGG